MGDDDSQNVSTMGNPSTHQNCQGWFDTASAGNHSHSFNTNNTGGHSHNVTGTSGGGGSHSHNVTGTSGSTGNSGTDKNLPPYYALCYIMKT